MLLLLLCPQMLDGIGIQGFIVVCPSAVQGIVVGNFCCHNSICSDFLRHVIKIRKLKITWFLAGEANLNFLRNWRMTAISIVTETKMTV